MWLEPPCPFGAAYRAIQPVTSPGVPSCHDRRADPERIYLARRAEVFAKLTQTGAIDELETEHRISAWEREAERQILERLTPAFWDAGERWIAEERAARRPGW
jgi:hypothetical protein